MLEHAGGTAVRFDVNYPSTQQIDIEVMARQGVARARYRLVNLPLYLVERALELT